MFLIVILELVGRQRDWGTSVRWHDTIRRRTTRVPACDRTAAQDVMRLGYQCSSMSSREINVRCACVSVCVCVCFLVWLGSVGNIWILTVVTVFPLNFCHSSVVVQSWPCCLATISLSLLLLLLLFFVITKYYYCPLSLSRWCTLILRYTLFASIVDHAIRIVILSRLGASDVQAVVIYVRYLWLIGVLS